MTKPANSPSTQDSGAPSAPPPPSPLRHYLWLVALVSFIVLFFLVPATSSTTQVSLTYSKFLTDVAAHKVKTVTLETTGAASGTLSNGKDYTTAIPTGRGPPFSVSFGATVSRSRPRRPPRRSGLKCCRG